LRYTQQVSFEGTQKTLTVLFFSNAVFVRRGYGKRAAYSFFVFLTEDFNIVFFKKKAAQGVLPRRFESAFFFCFYVVKTTTSIRFLSFQCIGRDTNLNHKN